MSQANTATKSKAKHKKGEQSFKKFVDFMYEHPELIKEFPQKIIFHDGTVQVKFS